MSEYDCIGVTSEYLETLKNKIKELEQQKAELIEIIKDVIQNFSGDDDFLIQDYLTYKFKKYI